MLNKILLFVLFMAAVTTAASAQQPDKKAEAPVINSGPSTDPAAMVVSDSILVTIFFKHQQDKSLPEIRRILESQGFWDIFPPADAEIVSWTVAMGLGHIVTVKVAASAVRRLNLAIQNCAWGAYDTEIYLTYDYKPVWEEYMEKRAEVKADRN